MVVMFVDKLMSVCCGDSELMNAMKNKLPWNKNHKNDDDDDDVADTNAKPNNKDNRNNIKLVHKKKSKFSDQEMKYELTMWKDLPLKARRAAEDLEYTPTKWDNAEDVPIEHKHWHDLSEKELKALAVLGWDDEAAWEHKYEHFNWKDLPELQKKAATSSGFDEEKWDDDHWPENLNKRWDDMTKEDQQAMAVLGWHKGKWD